MDDAKKLRRSLDRIEDALKAVPVNVAVCTEALGTARASLDSLLADWSPRCSQPAEEWCRALREQANDDLRAAEQLAAQPGAPLSVLAMLLQMAFEKIAKAVIARSDDAAFASYLTKHKAASRMVQLIRNQGQYSSLHYRWRQILPLVEALERAHPSLAREGRHLEYPWEDAVGVHLPLELPVVAELGDPIRPRAAELLRLARELLNRFDEIFT